MNERDKQTVRDYVATPEGANAVRAKLGLPVVEPMVKPPQAALFVIEIDFFKEIFAPGAGGKTHAMVWRTLTDNAMRRLIGDKTDVVLAGTRGMIANNGAAYWFNEASASSAMRRLLDALVLTHTLRVTKMTATEVWHAVTL